MDDGGSESYRLSDTLGEIGTGESQCPEGSCNFLVGGYRQSDTVEEESYISLTPASDVVLSPSIGGISGGAGTGNAAWKVTTNNLAGYQLDIRAGSSPALCSGSYNFLDYVPATSDPDFNWAINQNESRFGYSIEGSDIVSKFLDNGSICATGTSNNSDKCWGGFSTSNESIATSSLPNDPSGTYTTVKFRAEAGNQRMQEDGDYTATIVVTAIQL